MVNQSHSRWLMAVLQHHAAFLMSNPACEDLLGPMHSMLSARTKTHSDMLRLKGKLDVVTKGLGGKQTQEGGASSVAAFDRETFDQEALLGEEYSNLSYTHFLH